MQHFRPLLVAALTFSVFVLSPQSGWPILAITAAVGRPTKETEHMTTAAPRMMTFSDIAAHMKIGATVLKKLRKRPDFPAPAINFKRSDGRAALQRWYPGQIEDWVVQQGQQGTEVAA
jgi:hypothetical protein